MNHMNSKTLIGLGVAAAVAVAIAAGISASRKPVAESAGGGGDVVPGLAAHINDVRRISLTGSGQKRIATLTKTDNGWTLEEKGGYRADAGKVREYLLKLSQSQLTEPKTSNEARYAEIGVNDVGAADAKGLLVAFEGLPQPAQLIVGIANPRGDSTYVRRAGDKQSWLAKGSLIPDRTAASWLDRSIVDLPATRVREIAWTRADGKSVRVVKSKREDVNYTVADLPKGRELSSEFAANTQGTSLAGLNFDDVIAAAEASPPADGKVYRATFASFDGLVVDMTGWKKDEKFYAQFRTRKDEAAFDASVAAAAVGTKPDAKPETPVVPSGEATAAAAASDPPQDKAALAAKLDAEVATLAKRFDGWTFVLPAYKAANFDKSVEDFLKPPAGKGGPGAK
jgi:hypothetical protein